MAKLQGNLNSSALHKLEANDGTHSITVHVTGWKSG